MNRLTARTAPWCSSGIIPASKEEQKMIHKLARYEDAEEDGRLFITHLSFGQEVYFISNNKIIKAGVEEIDISCGYLEYYAIAFDDNEHRLDDRWFCDSDIGDSIFLTKEEAEIKLKELEG